MNNDIYPVPANFVSNINKKDYAVMYNTSLENSDEFWEQQAHQFVSWFSKWSKIRTGDFTTLDISWFKDATLNVSYNCLDRHLPTHKNKTAIIWEGDNPSDIKKITYGQLHEDVCKFANVLKNLGIKKGDKVCIYLPMIPEAAIAMLACTRIGAIHIVVFAGFSVNALQNRINHANAKIVITADESMRGGKKIVFKENVDKALKQCPTVQALIIIKNNSNKISKTNKKDFDYYELMQNASNICEAEALNSNDPLFILYTSGSTGQPKGIIHSTGGYLVYVASTFYYIFNYQNDDIYWCTADIGWITGHSYLIYGPLANGATTVMYEGTPYYPTFSRFWEIIERHKVTTFYTSPTALRALRKEGDDFIDKDKLSSLKLLGSVGEPINPDVWEWYYKTIGNSRCPIVDTWWQTETGGILISPIPGVIPAKPGSACWPFFGINPAIVNDNGEEIRNEKKGRLIIKNPWPGLAQSIYKDKDKFFETYFKEVPGAYLTGDGAYIDKDGYYWITGRNDDVIKVSGHRISSAEVESAFLCHDSISEAAIVAIKHKIKGQAIYAFVTTKKNIIPDNNLKNELINIIRKEIGPIATPEKIQWAQELPKTRSGKIMRRILRKIADNEHKDLGDISTLTNPDVIHNLIHDFLNDI